MMDSKQSRIEASSGSTESEQLITQVRPAFSGKVSQEQQYVKWGIVWYAPLLMILYGLGGLGVAIGHHFYYRSLHGTQAGSTTQQQISTAIGTGLSFLLVTLLRAGSCAAYAQYVWQLVRRKGYKLSTLDKMFALTTEPYGFFSLEMFKHAKIAVLIAVFCWITPLAGILPPATLSVVPGLVFETRPTSMGQVNWDSPAFYDIKAHFSFPSAEVQGAAIQSANGMAIVPLVPPSPNATFGMQFYGPAVSCKSPNSTQQIILNYYNNRTSSAGDFATEDTLALELRNKTKFAGEFSKKIASYNLLLYSAFAPYGGIQGWYFGIQNEDIVDQFNNWDVDLPWEMDDLKGKVDEALADDIIQQMYVQTAADGFHCNLGNASYDVDFEFINGIQTSVKYTTSDFTPIFSMRSGDGAGGAAMLSSAIVPGPYMNRTHTGFEMSYMSVWTSFTSLLSGNISMRYIPLVDEDNQDNYNLTLVETNSRILLNGLSACDELTNTSWSDLPPKAEDPNISPVAFFDPVLRAQNDSSTRLLHKPSWMCRNRTLIRAIEDLASNITISLLSSEALTSPNSTIIDVKYTRTQNVYQYSSLNLIISYTSAMILSIISIALGIFAIVDNGVAHSTAFSAIMATTRNPNLDQLMNGHSLGTMPLDEEVSKAKLKFGTLDESRKSASRLGRLGFGFENTVHNVEKFGKYI